MRLEKIRIEDFRAFAAAEVELSPGWNLLLGPNGAGKTTLLEAAYLLSHGRSFRSAPRDALVRHGAAGWNVFGTVATRRGSALRVGLARGAGGIEARLDGGAIAMSELLRHVAVVCFEPGSHELISGPSEGRRRFLDWGVFHVEHEFLDRWRRYHRALRQRNATLKAAGAAAEIDAWDRELASSGEDLTAARTRYVAPFAAALGARLRDLLGELGEARVELSSGWPRGEALIDVLAASREDDLRRGFTTRGPHRADWSITFEAAPRREHLSRGQEKLTALGAVLAQSDIYAEASGEWPIVCIDDLASELDQPHQETLLRTLPSEAQIIVTGTQLPAGIAASGRRPATFHVEPGRVIPLI